MDSESVLKKIQKSISKAFLKIYKRSDAERLSTFDIESDLIKFIKTNNVKQLKLLLEGQMIGVNESVMHNLKLSMLCLAVSVKKKEITKLLLAWNADVNFQDDFQVTPVMKAVAVGDNEILELLMNSAVNLGLKDDIGRTAIDYAEFYENKKAMKMLKKRLDENH
jgi:ankyrin repeat protein